jgi:hypothetical protein
MYIEKDCHGMTTKEVYDFLINLNTKEISEIKLITGIGKHSQNRPQMDYFCEKEWKCPIKQVIIDYIVYEKKQGALMTEFPSFILWKIPKN